MNLLIQQVKNSNYHQFHMVQLADLFMLTVVITWELNNGLFLIPFCVCTFTYFQNFTMSIYTLLNFYRKAPKGKTMLMKRLDVY